MRIAQGGDFEAQWRGRLDAVVVGCRPYANNNQERTWRTLKWLAGPKDRTSHLDTAELMVKLAEIFDAWADGSKWVNCIERVDRPLDKLFFKELAGKALEHLSDGNRRSLPAVDVTREHERTEGSENTCHRAPAGAL